jgi:hypothetical protein
VKIAGKIGIRIISQIRKVGNVMQHGPHYEGTPKESPV